MSETRITQRRWLWLLMILLVPYLGSIVFIFKNFGKE